MNVIKTAKTQLAYGLSHHEFRCKCNRCSATIVNQNLLNSYAEFRTLYAKPITITCGYRCQAHNEEIDGSASCSRHISGEALDMVLRPLLDHFGGEYKLRSTLMSCSFSYVEINLDKNYIHVNV